LERLNVKKPTKKSAIGSLNYKSLINERKDIGEITVAIIEMLTHENPAIVELAEDIIGFNYLTKGVQDSTNIIQHIPVEYLTGIGFSDGVREINFNEVNYNLVDNFLSQPLIFSNRVKSHPLEIFLVIMISGTLFGIVGMIIAVPTYTVIKVILQEFLSDNKIVQSLTKNF